MKNFGCHGNRLEKLKKCTPPKPVVQFHCNLIEMIIGWSFLKVDKTNEIHEELWLPWQPFEKT